MSKTRNQKEKKRKVEGSQPRYKHNSNSVYFGTAEDFVARIECRYYRYLDAIFSYATWNGENWVKPNIDNFPNPIEEDFSHLIEENLEVRDSLTSKKWIFQSTDHYWIEALKYHVYLENGGKDLTQPNSNIHKTEWIEDPEKVTTK
tara:strand:+ start:50 stop:487 length:438 start_codon:yes stop_codon:yes gene_type:complete